jgi:hypothetical protein
MAQRSQRTFPVLKLMTFAHHKIFASHLNGLKAERLECPRSPKPQDQRGENQQKQDGAEKEGDGRNHPDRRFSGTLAGLLEAAVAQIVRLCPKDIGDRDAKEVGLC